MVFGKVLFAGLRLDHSRVLRDFDDRPPSFLSLLRVARGDLGELSVHFR